MEEIRQSLGSLRSRIKRARSYVQLFILCLHRRAGSNLSPWAALPWQAGRETSPPRSLPAVIPVPSHYLLKSGWSPCILWLISGPLCNSMSMSFTLHHFFLCLTLASVALCLPHKLGPIKVIIHCFLFGASRVPGSPCAAALPQSARGTCLSSWLTTQDVCLIYLCFVFPETGTS